ncbi:MAG: tRNA (adenosine(37)-N6)-threonylcarbamoyltransferase complex ATPase subunit type 1 TsaE [Bacteroidetes bacterium]|nr:tRNA (adenosine(37)-N6)-threonylcarbamoyltransferase complex ATPase subunit type 1 TsaE [Bacteroidota bacterium]
MLQGSREFRITSIQELDKLVPEILQESSESGIVLFQGEIGAGKTTLIQRICALLGVKDPVTSPTFSLVNEYSYPKGNGKIGRIYHLDLYRLESPEEALNIGLEDYLYDGDYCFIEWPEIAEEYLPENVLLLRMEHLADSNRKILFLQT